MDKVINRRRLVAGAAALPIAAALPAEAKTANVVNSENPQIAPFAPPTKPDISEIPGLDQVNEVICVVVVRTFDGRTGFGNLEFCGFGDVNTATRTADGWQTAVLPGDGLESLPTWFQREIGYAAMAANDDRQ